MPDVRSYRNITQLLGDPGSSADKMEQSLKRLSNSELRQINDALSRVDLNHDPIGDWRDELKRDRPTTMFSELILVSQCRRVMGHENVVMNAEIPGTNKDFDLRVKWCDREFWIEVVKPDFVDQIPDGGGWMPQTRTPNAIDRKLTGEFKAAREALQDAILVLAVYLEAGAPQKIMIGKWLNDQHYHPGEYADAFWEFTHPFQTTRIDVRELTDRGEFVTDLRDFLIE